MAQSSPRDANRFYKQGRYLSEQENFEQAVQAFDQALQIDPTHALALNARGYARLRLHNYQGAIDDCSQAIRLNPNYANAYLNRSVAKRAMGDVAGSRDDQHRASGAWKRRTGAAATAPSRSRLGNGTGFRSYCSGRSFWPLPPFSPSSGITVGITDAAAT